MLHRLDVLPDLIILSVHVQRAMVETPTDSATNLSVALIMIVQSTRLASTRTVSTHVETCHVDEELSVLSNSTRLDVFALLVSRATRSWLVSMSSVEMTMTVGKIRHVTSTVRHVSQYVDHPHVLRELLALLTIINLTVNVVLVLEEMDLWLA